MKKRVNTRFLIILTSSIVGLGVLAIVAKKAFFRQHADQYVQLGDRAMESEKFDEAIVNYETAFRLSNPKDPMLLVKEGDALRAQTATEPELLNKEMQAYARALEVNPRFKPALQRMLKGYEDRLELFPNRQEYYLSFTR